MRLGSDALKLPGAHTRGPVEQLDDAVAHGLDGLFFRTMLHLSPSLDPGELREIRVHADASGLYLEAGLGIVNPYALPEMPRIRALGDGDTLAGFRRMMEAAARIGVTELWAETAGIKPYAGRLCYDRFRTDVDWPDQLAATEKFLHRLAPIARDLGVHINPETHEEITSFELVRLVEAVGPDVMGITYDTSNPLQRAESPRLTAERVAPYVRQTHIKDTALVRTPDGLRDQLRPVGRGVVDMHAILPALYRANPNLTLSLEIAEAPPDPPPDASRRPKSKPQPGKGSEPPSRPRASAIALYDPDWIAGHPDLTVAELLEVLWLAQGFENRVAAGEAESLEAYASRPYTEADAWAFVAESFEHLRAVLIAEGLT